MTHKIAVLIDAKLHNELVLRTRKADDVTHFIEHAVEAFLGNTEDSEELWSGEYFAELDEKRADIWVDKYGDPKKGYHWGILFLPNSTQLKMTYKGRDYFAEVRHGKIMDGDIEYSPSEWVSKVANHTSRNAWRDIYVKLPGETHWKIADAMRRGAQERLS